MTQQSCSFCGKSMEAKARFCSACGTELQPASRLSPSPLTNADTNVTGLETAAATEKDISSNLHIRIEMPLKGNNDNPEALKPSHRRRNFLAVCLGLAALLLVSGSYYYYDQARTTRLYLESSAAAAGQISSLNTMLTSHLGENIDAHQIAALEEDIASYKTSLQATADEWEVRACPAQYQSQQQSLRTLLSLENTILQQIPAALANPLPVETDAVLSSLRENITQIDQLSAQIQMPGVAVAFESEFLLVPDRIADYCTNQRQIYKEKLARLESLTTYFNKMDEIIQSNNAAKQNLNSMLDTIRSGESQWADYFALLADARAQRDSLRQQVDNLSPPAGTEGHKKDLSRLLTLSLEYCDIMKAGAALEQENNFTGANEKYLAAQKLNDKIQDAYWAFTNQYAADKARLTNIDNLL